MRFIQGVSVWRRAIAIDEDYTFRRRSHFGFWVKHIKGNSRGADHRDLRNQREKRNNVEMHLEHVRELYVREVVSQL